MRRLAMVVVLLSMTMGGVASAHPHDPGDESCKVGKAAPDGHLCFPTPAQCATGEYTGSWIGSTDYPPNGTTIRGAFCVGSGGSVFFYSGGYPAGLCGTVVVANVTVADNSPVPGNPNSCP